jgi:metallophosphoesterase (TIGR00282 family)
MKILFIGDIVGNPGRKAVRKILPSLIGDHGINFVIANCENAAAGFGVTREIVEELFGYGINVLTSGNHIWDKREIHDFIEDYENLLRPANYPAGTPGWGSVASSSPSGHTIGVINLEGRVFMRYLDCPFKKAEAELKKLKAFTPVVIIDIHAEATAEKKALAWFLDGSVTAVLGTHTHVQTADNEIFPQGTAYISDAGMTGAFNSVLGMKVDHVLYRFLTQISNRFEVAKHDIRLQGVVIDIDEQTWKSKDIYRISEKIQDE